jgi:hypothetical protein
MTRLALAAILAATSANAGPVNLTDAPIEGDKAELHMEGTAMGVLTYSNTALQRSANGTWEVASDQVLCLLTIVAKGGGPETASVECAEGWQVEPQSAEVPDGEVFHFIVTYPQG